MSSSNLFVDRATGSIDTDQIIAEAIPIATLIGLFVAVALVPLVLAFLLGDVLSVLGALFMLVTQFVLAVGASIVLLYVIARAIQLADA